MFALTSLEASPRSSATHPSVLAYQTRSPPSLRRLAVSALVHDLLHQDRLIRIVKTDAKDDWIEYFEGIPQPLLEIVYKKFCKDQWFMTAVSRE